MKVNEEHNWNLKNLSIISPDLLITEKEKNNNGIKFVIHTPKFFQFSWCYVHSPYPPKVGGFTLVVAVGGVTAICEHLQFFGGRNMMFAFDSFFVIALGSMLGWDFWLCFFFNIFANMLL